MKKLRSLVCLFLLVTAVTAGCESPTPKGAARSEVAARVSALQVAGAQQILAPDGTFLNQFGYAVALYGSAAVVGDPVHVVQGVQGTGLVFAYDQVGGRWNRQASPLVGSDSARGSSFGYAVAMSGDTLLVGAPNHTVGGTSQQQGAAYVFVRSGGTWTQQGPPLVAPDGAAFDTFGRSVALSGDTALVAAHGGAACYVFVRTGTTWAPQGPALPRASTVALSGDTALLGYVTLDAPGTVLVFVRAGGTWTQQGSALASPDAVAGDGFGETVAIDGDTALIGAPHREVRPAGGGVSLGSAYVFVRAGGSWAVQASLPKSEPALDNFGSAVALWGETAVVGADLHAITAPVSGTTYINAGSAYLFTRSQGVWTQFGSPLRPSPINETRNAVFGNSAAVFGDSVMVGAFGFDDLQPGREDRNGAAYAFSIVGRACTGASGCTSGLCVDGFCCDTPCASSCDACSVALGGRIDGLCSIITTGAVGSPACAPGACNGAVAACTACERDLDCPPTLYCARTRACLPRKAVGATCNLTSSGDCYQFGCRACDGPGNGVCASGCAAWTTAGEPVELAAPAAGEARGAPAAPAARPGLLAPLEPLARLELARRAEAVRPAQPEIPARPEPAARRVPPARQAEVARQARPEPPLRLAPPARQESTARPGRAARPARPARPEPPARPAGPSTPGRWVRAAPPVTVSTPAAHRPRAVAAVASLRPILTVVRHSRSGWPSSSQASRAGAGPVDGRALARPTWWFSAPNCRRNVLLRRMLCPTVRPPVLA